MVSTDNNFGSGISGQKKADDNPNFWTWVSNPVNNKQDINNALVHITSSADGFSARLARFMATLGSSQGPSPRSPSRNNRPELGVDLGRGVEHRSDVRFEYDRDDWPCDVSRKSVRFRLGIVEFVLAAHSVCVRWRIFLG